MSSIAIERTFPHPREKVWRAVTTQEALATWLMPNDFELRVGHEFTFRTEPAPGFDGIVHCRVLEIEPPSRLVFTWKGGPIDTIVTFRLHEVRGGTRFRMEQSGFEGFKARLVSKMLKSGGRSIYGKKLPEYLDSMPDGPGQEATPTATGRAGSEFTGSELAAIESANAPAQNPKACMNPWTRFLAWVSTQFTKKGT